MTPSMLASRIRRALGRSAMVGLASVVGALGILVGVSGTVGVVVAGPAGPASARADACGFVDLSDAAAVQARAAESDAVFYVRLRRDLTDPADADATRSDWQVRVIDGLLGDTDPPSRVVRFDVSMVPNPRVLAAGNDLVLFAVDPVDQPATGAVFDVDLCTGVGVPADGALTLDDRAALTAVLEAGQEAAAEPEVPTIAYSDRDDRAVDLGRTIAPGAALVLVGFLGLVLVSWAGRQRH